MEWQEADELGDSDDDSDDETMVPSSSSLKAGNELMTLLGFKIIVGNQLYSEEPFSCCCSQT